MDKLASLYNIHLRTGCFCNTGACQHFLDITDQEVKNNLKVRKNKIGFRVKWKSNFKKIKYGCRCDCVLFSCQAGHVCGDSIDLVDGKPTGSVRVSFGYMSTFDDCQTFLSFVVDCFVEKPPRVDRVRLENLRQTKTGPCGNSHQERSIKLSANGGIKQEVETRRPAEPSLEGCVRPSSAVDTTLPKNPYTLTHIYIYPVKSCAAFEVCVHHIFHRMPTHETSCVYKLYMQRIFMLPV